MVPAGTASGIASGMLSSMSEQAEKVRENQLRRAAARQGLRLVKSRRRDPRALDFGMWWVVEVQAPGGHWRSRVLLSSEQGMSLDEVEEFLTTKS